MARFKAALFDLDGVLADSAREHFAAWKRLADEIGVPFDEKANERLKGVDRMTSLEFLLEGSKQAYSSDEKAALAERKNMYYREAIERVTSDDLLPGALAALEACREAGLKTALASASRNAPTLIARLGISGLIDFIADAGKAAKSKPAPDIFLMAAKGVNVDPSACLGLDDAAAGVASAKAAGTYVIGVGDPVILKDADDVIKDMEAFELSRYLSL